MRLLFFGVLFGLLAGALHAQQEGLQPKYTISASIAKNPEPSDFYGSWARGDGGYRIEVKAGEGKDAVVVGYFNPAPINVESSTFDVVDKEPRLTFVLRDTGYPGSSYQLMFLPERRVLVGTYTRPGGEPSQVYFVNEAE